MTLDSISLLDVWPALGGGPLRGNRGRAFWRDGEGYNVALDAPGGRWYDHRDHIGGGVTKLVEVALGCDWRAARKWIADFTGVPLNKHHWTALERRKYARARTEAAQLVEWKSEMLKALEREQARWWEIYHGSLRYVLAHCVDDAMYHVMATTHELAEETIEKLNRQIAMVDGSRYPELLPIFRDQKRRDA